MDEKIICTKLNKNDILPADKGEVCYIGGLAFPVTGHISTGLGEIPIADIPVMSDEKWRELSKKC